MTFDVYLKRGGELRFENTLHSQEELAEYMKVLVLWFGEKKLKKLKVVVKERPEGDARSFM